MPNDLATLQQAKAESDRKNYKIKHMLLRQMLRRDPDAFIMDGDDTSHVRGITHTPTGFQFHMPANTLPADQPAVSQAIKVARDVVDRMDWESVPAQVNRLIKTAAPVARTVKRIIKNLPSSDYGYVFYHPENHELWAVLGDGDGEHIHQKWHNALKAVKGITQVRTEAESHPSNKDEWVMIKKSDASAIGAPFRWGGALTGGASPLSNAIVGSLLTGGAGYLGGTIMENLFPDDYVEKGRLRKTLGLTGLGLGALPGVWDAFANHSTAAEAGKPMGALSSLVTPTNNIPISEPARQATKNYGIREGAPYNPANGRFERPQATEGVNPRGFPQYNLNTPDGSMPYDHMAVMNGMQDKLKDYPEAPEHLVKAAALYAKLASIGQPEWWQNEADMSNTIQTDQFQQQIFADPYTPRPVAAAAAGLTQGVSQMVGQKNLLHPKHFITGLAAAGADLLTANLIGGTLGALAGLTPKAQDKIQQMGLWGGLMRGTVGSLLS